MKFEILTIFPELFAPFREVGLLGKGVERKIIDIGVTDVRNFATDKHKTVDDTPYGGGAGMVLKIEPIARAIGSINDQFPSPKSQTRQRTVVLSARGKQFTQAKAKEYAKLNRLVLICGRYEGIDQRVADYLADEEISTGPYVLNGGEVAAMSVIEATARLVPGVLGNIESLEEESFTWLPRTTLGAGPLTSFAEYPQYTKPAEFRGWKVPEVLLSGNHEEITRWRKKMSREKQVDKC